MVAFTASLILAGMQVASAAPAPSAPATLQQRFDAATEQLMAGDCAAALPAFTALENEAGVRRNGQVLATVRLRKGRCQLRTGEREAGMAAIRASLSTLDSAGENYRDDLIQGRLALARALLGDLDYAGAEAQLERVLAQSQGVARVEPLALLTHVTMFDGGAKPLAYAEEALRLAQADAGASKELIAGLRTNHARVLLNQQRFKEGYAELKEALKLQGGLDLRVGLRDLATRSDLAIAALLTGDQDGARKYLAYTGAGRMKDAPFSRALSMRTPLCSDVAGLRPEDRAIVEFSIAEDGGVAMAAPVYSTGDRTTALEFAEAVRSWSWRPEQVKDIPELFRAAARVELRCSTVGERPSLFSVLEADTDQWLRANGHPVIAPSDNATAMVAQARTALDQRSAPTGPARLGPLLVLAQSPLVAPEERTARASEAAVIAAAASAPPAVRTLIATQRLSADPTAERSARRYHDGLRALLAEPSIAGDAHSAATLRLALARESYERSAASDADAQLAAIIADDRLTKDDPLRIAALLEQASRAAAKGSMDAARTAFASTGLTEQQCALVGLEPAMRSSGAGSSDFPMEAMRWGFEGWTKTEFDVLADGRTTAQRAIIAYPPFVFNDAAAGIAQDARYRATYRPSGSTACSGTQMNVSFQIPQ